MEEKEWIGMTQTATTDQNNRQDIEKRRQDIEDFVKLSEVLTGFSVFELHATGMVEAYYDTACRQLTATFLKKLTPGLETSQVQKLTESPADTSALASPLCDPSQSVQLISKPISRQRATSEVRKFSDERAGNLPDAELVLAAVCALTEMWYLGHWPALPAEAYALLTKNYGDHTDTMAPAVREMTTKGVPPNVSFVVSPQSYVESLVWRTFVGGHPLGAKPPGFGSWAVPPSDPWTTNKPKSQPGTEPAKTG
jgi:hypothetical protein